MAKTLKQRSPSAFCFLPSAFCFRRTPFKLRKLLVIDDDEQLAIKYRELLLPYGFQILIAHNGEEAMPLVDHLMELEESLYWMELLVAAEIIPQERLEPLTHETEELIAIFVSPIRKWRKP